MIITKEHIRKAKDIDMRTLLATEGYSPSYETSTVVAYRSMLPGRFENVPSFMLSRKNNTWKDYGLDSQSHDTIDFVQKYKQVSFGEAVKYLLGDIPQAEPFDIPPKKTKPSVLLEDVRDIISSRVYSYISGRGISPHRARNILKEVVVSFPYGKNPSRHYLLVGHKNDSGGWDCRNNFFKTISVSPKDVTTIRGSGESYSVFEGIFDYLSALEYFDIDQFRGNVIILNSCAFAGAIAPFLSGKRVYSFTDNDKSGQEVIDVFKAAGALVKDERHHYRGFNDFNDKLKP